MSLSDVTGLVGAVAGVLGLGVAGWALHYSRDSRNIARDGSDDARTAIDLAEKSNTIAEEAKQVAEEANTISLRAEQRDTERHDVAWDLDWPEPGEYVLTNTGTDAARRVRVRVTVDMWEAVEQFDVVEGGGSVTVSVPEAAQEFRSEQLRLLRAQRDAENERRRRAAQPFPTVDLGFDVASTSLHMEFTMHHIGYRVDWETDLGRHCNASDEFKGSLGEHDF